MNRAAISLVAMSLLIFTGDVKASPPHFVLPDTSFIELCTYKNFCDSLDIVDSDGDSIGVTLEGPGYLETLLNEPGHWVGRYCINANSLCGNSDVHNIIIIASDGFNNDTLYYNILFLGKLTASMEDTISIYPGYEEYMPVYLEDSDSSCFCLGGFEFTVEYDASVLTVDSVKVGEALYTDSIWNGSSWDYDYDFHGEYWNVNYGLGFVSLVFINELHNQIPVCPIYDIDEEKPIFEIEFLLAPDEYHHDFCIPVCFSDAEPNHNYNVIADEDGYTVWWTGGCDDPADSTQFVTLLLELECGNVKALNPGSIAGIVTETDGTTPIIGAMVRALQDGSEIDSDITDEFGEYEIANLPDGTYDVFFSRTGYRDTTVTGITVIASDTTILDVILNSLTDVGVSAISSPSDTMIVGLSYPLVAEVTNYGTSLQTFDVIFEVYILNSLVAELADTLTITSMTGLSVDTVAFSDSLIPTVDTTFELISYTTLAGDENLGNDTTTSISYSILPPGYISGTVTDTSGVPIESVYVEVDESTLQLVADSKNLPDIYGKERTIERGKGGILLESLNSVYTDENGYYEVVVPAGTYDVSFSHPNYQDTTVTGITVIASDTTILDVILNSLTDVGVSAILSPSDTMIVGLSYPLIAEVTNYGVIPQTFDAIFEVYILDSVVPELTDTLTITSIAGLSVDTVTFGDSLIPTVDTTYELISYTTLAGDENPGNDTATSITYSSFGYGAVSGIVTDEASDSIQGVHVELIGTGIVDTTNVFGEYFLGNISTGTYDVFFSRTGYRDTTVTGITVTVIDTTILDVILTLWPPWDEVVVWYGNVDDSPVEAFIGDRVYIDAYIQTSDSVYVAYLHLCLSTQDQYIDSLLSDTEGDFNYYPLSEWDEAVFLPPQGSPPNPEGWSSQSFLGWADLGGPPNPWLHFENPTKILTYVVKAVNNPGLIGDTIQCLESGLNTILGPSEAVDTLGIISYSITEYFSSLNFVANYPVLVISDSLVFLQGYVGIICSDTFMIYNSGTQDLCVEISGPDWVSVSDPVDTIAPSESSSFVIENAPDLDSAGYYTDALVISSNDPNNPLVQISVEMNYIFPPLVLISPTSDDYVSLPVGFVWHDLAGNPTYTLGVYEDSLKSDTVYYADLADTLLSLGEDSLALGENYYYQVKATIGLIEGKWTILRKFTVINGVPFLLSPADNDTVTYNPTFIWSRVHTASRYYLKITADENLSELIWSEQTYQDTSYYFDQLGLLTPDSTYYWSVSAKLNGVWEPYAEPFAIFRLAPIDTLCSPDPQIPGPGDSLSFPATFSWDDTCGSLEYTIFILTDSLFSSDTLWEGQSVTQQIQVPDMESMPVDSQYYWVLQGFAGDGTPSHYSPFVDFVKRSSDLPVVPPVVVYPLESDTVFIDTISFTWNPVEGATYYQLQYSIELSFPDDPYRTWTIDNITNCYYDLISPANSGYIYWHVKACNNTYHSDYSSPIGFYYLGGFGEDITEIRIVRPSDGFVGEVGQALSGHAYFVGSYVGQVTGAWYLNESVFSEFNEYMDSSGLNIDSPNLPTDLARHDTLQISITYPEPLASNSVAYSIEEPQFTSAEKLSIVAEPQTVPADTEQVCILTILVLDTEGRHKIDDITRTIYIDLSGEGTLDSSIVHSDSGTAIATYSPSVMPDTVTITASSEGLDSAEVIILTYESPINQMVTVGGEMISRLGNLELETIESSPPTSQSFNTSSHLDFLSNNVNLPFPEVNDTLGFRRMMAADKIMNYAYYFDNSLFFDQSGRTVLATLGMWDRATRLSQAYTGMVLWAADSGQVIAAGLPEPYSSFFTSLYGDMRASLDNKFADIANGIAGYAGNTLLSLGDDIILSIENGLISGDSLFHLLIDEDIMVSGLDVAGGEYIISEQHWIDSIYNWTYMHYFSGDLDNGLADSVINFIKAKTDLTASQVEGYGASEMVYTYIEDLSYLPSDGLGQAYELVDIAFDILNNQAFTSSINLLAQTADEIPYSTLQSFGLIFNGNPLLLGSGKQPFYDFGKGFSKQQPDIAFLSQIIADFNFQNSNYELTVRELIERATDDDSLWVAEHLDSLHVTTDILTKSFETGRAPLIAAYQEALLTIPGYDLLYLVTDFTINQSWLRGKKFEMAVIEFLLDHHNPVKLENLILKGNQAISAGSEASIILQDVLNLLFTTPATPLVIVDHVDLPLIITAGKVDTLEIFLINNGSGEAQQVYVSIEPGVRLEIEQTEPIPVGDIPSGQIRSGSTEFTVIGDDLGVFRLYGKTTARIRTISENSQTRSKQLRFPYKADVGWLEFLVTNESEPLKDVLIEVVYEFQQVTNGQTDSMGSWLTRELYPTSYQVNLTKDGYEIIDTVLSVQGGETTQVNITMISTYQCYYVPGDANGDGSVMGNDVTYGVRYFKGLGNPPPDSCWNDSTESWLYSAGDVNGSCTFTGSDITYFVAYFKGINPEILWCPQTPPAGPPVLGIHRDVTAVVLPKK